MLVSETRPKARGCGIRAAFLDRDGTIIEDMHYGGSPEMVRPVHGAREALELLRGAGFLLFVVTNQSGAARGFISRNNLLATHREMERRLGMRFNGLEFCPHVPGERCGCRKPSPGMIKRITLMWPEIDLARSVTIGDNQRDVVAGKAMGTRTVLIAERAPDGLEPDLVTPSIVEAAEWAVENLT
ncbi:MAG: D-glycero-alpha-D-manno-heptose-1,7-bisphosphate 7-phosphatase [candidate division WOR-3 bacterium]